MQKSVPLLYANSKLSEVEIKEEIQLAIGKKINVRPRKIYKHRYEHRFLHKCDKTLKFWKAFGTD
jgi:hypothetical protein